MYNISWATNLLFSPLYFPFSSSPSEFKPCSLFPQETVFQGRKHWNPLWPWFSRERKLELNPESYTGGIGKERWHVQSIPENCRQSKVSPVQVGKQQSMTYTQTSWHNCGIGHEGCAGTPRMSEVKQTVHWPSGMAALITNNTECLLCVRHILRTLTCTSTIFFLRLLTK